MKCILRKPCNAFFNFGSPKVPQKWAVFYYLEVSGASYCIDAVGLLVSDLVAKDKSKDSRQ